MKNTAARSAFFYWVTFSEIHLDKAENIEMISDYQNMDGNG